jgi:hypothetical protein
MMHGSMNIKFILSKLSFLFNNVIYVFLLLCLCILIVCLCMATLAKVFPCFFLSCKANVRVKPAKTEHGSHFLIFVLFYVFFVLFYVFFCCSMYFLFCVVLCIVCAYMFIVLLPPADYPIAVKYIISLFIDKHLEFPK